MPPTPTPAPVDREIRFALAMNGGVSLAVWIGGVSDEVLRLCVAGVASDGFGLDAAAPDPSWSVYQQLCWAAGARVRVDVMSGASAGGMNAGSRVTTRLRCVHASGSPSSARWRG